jgi:hypothetical protein
MINNVNDYVLARHGKKPYLGKVLEADSKEVIVQVEELCHVSALRIVNTLKTEEVILNIGPNPTSGKIYGVEVGTRFYGRKTHDTFGTINWFYRPSKQVTADLNVAFDKAFLILKKHKLEFLLDDIVWEILPYSNEMYCGMFLKSKNETRPNRIQIKPEIMPSSEYVYCIIHELMHHLHLSFVKSKKINANWIKMFNTSIKSVNITKKLSQELLDALMQQEDNVSTFKGQLSEDEALAYKDIIRTISRDHSITVKELDLLFEADLKDEIKSVWPMRDISRKELAPIVSLYATTKTVELVAEACSFYLVSRKLPKPIVDLVEKTISYAKANKNTPTLD